MGLESRCSNAVIGELECVVQQVSTMLGVQGFQRGLDTTKWSLVNWKMWYDTLLGWAFKFSAGSRYNKLVIGDLENMVQEVTLLGVHGFQRGLDTTKWSLVNWRIWYNSPLRCPLSCPLFPYMEVVGSLICMAKFP